MLAVLLFAALLQTAPAPAGRVDAAACIPPPTCMADQHFDATKGACQPGAAPDQPPPANGARCGDLHKEKTPKVNPFKDK